MDQELIAAMNQISMLINSLQLNTEFPRDKLFSIQEDRARIERQINSFNDEIARRNNDFKNKIKRELENLQKKIQSP